MLFCGSYKIFMNIYFTEHFRAAASIFCIFFLPFWLKKLSEWFSSISETVAVNSVSKSFGCRNRYQYTVIWKCQNFLNTIASLKLFEDILKYLSLGKRPPCHCWHIPKSQWKRPVYPDYFFSCDYAYNNES